MSTGLSEVREPIHTIDIKLNGEKVACEVAFDLNAFADLEDIYGNVDNAFKALEEGSIKAIRSLLYVGLKAKHPELTERQVGAGLGMGDFKRIATVLEAAIKSALPTDIDESELDVTPEGDEKTVTTTP